MRAFFLPKKDSVQDSPPTVKEIDPICLRKNHKKFRLQSIPNLHLLRILAYMVQLLRWKKISHVAKTHMLQFHSLNSWQGIFLTNASELPLHAETNIPAPDSFRGSSSNLQI